MKIHIQVENSLQIKTPKEFFGKQPGDDRVMIHWEQLCAYYREAAKLSERLILEEKGKTSEGNDFLILYVSAPENLARLEEYRQISMALSDPRGLTQDEIDELVNKGKTIVFQSYGLHSNEVGGPQMVPLMLYELLTSKEAKIKKILSEVIFIISPCSEPDGEIVFTNWYHKYLGTEYEGICSPYLRHNWAGHSNNRDALRECVIESRHLNDIIIRRFMPQIVQDHHHQCPDENRMSISPKSDPICTHICPIVHRETAVYGTHMALELSAAGRKGIVAGDPLFCDFPITSFYGNACLHNIAGMLTENADVHIATPSYIDPQTLKLRTKREHVLEPCAVCPDPWEGGWWHLRDIVEQMYISSMSLIDYAANNRERILKSMVQKALYQTKRGRKGEIKAYVITQEQNDLSAAEHLIELMYNQRIDMFRLKTDIINCGRILPKGSIYIPLAQPKYAVIQVMLSEEPFSKQHVKALELNKENSCDTDTANICMSLTMGVNVNKLEFEIDSNEFEIYNTESGKWESPQSACENASYQAANFALSCGKKIFRDSNGDFKELIGNEIDGELKFIRRARVGLLKLGSTWNEEEGYTRSFLRMFDCDYRVIMDSEIREKGVPVDMDIVIIPGDRAYDLRLGDEDLIGYPKEYRRGVGTEGQKHLREFVARGGRLIAWEKSCEFVNALFCLGLVDKSIGLNQNVYLTGGSQLNAIIAREKYELTFGMPKKFTLTHSNGPILVPRDFAGKKVISFFTPLIPNFVLSRMALTSCF